MAEKTIGGFWLGRAGNLNLINAGAAGRASTPELGNGGREVVDPGRTKSELVAESELDAGKNHPEEPGARTEPDA